MTDNKDKQFSLGICDISKHGDTSDDEDFYVSEGKDISQQLPDQGVFDFDAGNKNGLEEYRAEIDKTYECIAEEWSLPINKRVRVSLFDFEGVYEGILQVVEIPSVVDKREPLYLRVSNVCFYNVDIETIETI